MCLALSAHGAAGATAESAPDWERRVQELFEQSEVPGMVAVVVHEDDVLWSGGRGTDSTGEPMGPESVVAVASVTKSFTATAVVQHAQSAGIDLDSPVSTWLPEFTMADDRYRSITIRQLLTHTSGLTDAGVGYYRTVNQGAASSAEHVAALAPHGLSSRPGERFAYANINYVLLGRLLEARTGRPVAEHLRTNLLEPHGLKYTVLDRAAAPDGFNSVFGRWVPREDTSQAMRQDPAGGIFTTADDLGRWLIASNGRGPTPVPKTVRDVLLTTVPAAPDAGAGWMREDRPGWWGHGGNRYTYSAYAMRNPTTGWAVAVVVNGASMNDPAYDMAQQLAATGEGGPGPTVPSAVRLDRWALAATVGWVACCGLLCVGARRWARRRSRARRSLGLLWPAVLVMVVVLTPQWAGLLVGGIQLTWPMLSYYSLTPLLTVLAGGAGAACVLTSRVWALRRGSRR